MDMARVVIQQEGLFRVPGSVKTMKEVKEAIDVDGSQVIWDMEKEFYIVPSICSLLKLWLRELPEGLVPPDDFRRFLEARGKINCRTGLSKSLKVRLLSEDVGKIAIAARSIKNPYKSALIYLCRFLISVSALEKTNRMSRTNVSIIFGPCIFKDINVDPNKPVDPGRDLVKENFLYIKWIDYILEHFDEIYSPASFSCVLCLLRFSSLFS
jgi:hypothetical protein